jgi:imidazole glycerol phosphate synthase glutamine amidotransferase subunit
MSKVVVFDYGAGNLRSVLNALGAIGAQYELVDDAEGLLAAEEIILPGVGHFGQMVRSLDAMRVRKPLLMRIAQGVPFLGICLGLQAMFEASEEAPDLEGLGLFAGKVRRFPTMRGCRTWVGTSWRSGPVRACCGTCRRGPISTFAHSYYVPAHEYAAATCIYSEPFTAVLEHENVYGVQFHPEKSGALGLQIVKNFVDL